MRKKGYLLIAGMALVLEGFSQKQASTSQQTWFNYFNQTRFTNKWGLWLDASLRTKEEFVNHLSQSIVRAGITYYLTDKAKLTAGYGFINHYPAEGHQNISQPEHRPWQQIQWHHSYPKLRTMQWIRLEERFRHRIKNNDELGEGYNFNYRIRYNLYLAYPLSQKAFSPRSFSFVANDEVHLNFGKEIVYNTFDQNRLFFGLNYHTNAHDQLQFGYMHIFQQLGTGSRYKNIQTIRLSYFHNLDLRKNKK